MSDKKFQILSLDGGGIKGVFSACFLANIESDLKIKIQDHFDLIVGTSTGGIIALGLGSGMSPAEILDFYVKEGEGIFSDSFCTKIKHYFFRKHSSKTLEKALTETFGEKKLGDCFKRLVITSYSMTNNDIYLFRTPHLEKLKRDFKIPIKDIALATGAAPTYFSAYCGIDNNRLVDGGVFANNPIMIGVTEAVGFLDSKLADTSCLSIGTTAPVRNWPKYLNYSGLLGWANTAPDLIMEGQSISATKQAENLLGCEQVLRINPPVADREFSLDGVKSMSELVAKASHVSRSYAPKIKKMFTSHKAPEFNPYHLVER